MNYGILVLGATIQISLFLRICSASVSTDFRKDPPFLQPQSVEEFQEAIGYSHTVYGWLTQRPDYVMDRMIWDSLAPSTPSPGEEELLKIFLYGDSGDQYMGPPLDEFRGDVGDYCTNFTDNSVRYFDGESDKNESQMPRTRKLDSEGNLIPPPGCEYVFVDGNELKGLMLQCKNAEMTIFPKIEDIPPVLEYFTMSATKVVKIPKRAFDYVEIKAVKLNHNKITDVDPHAFDGVIGLKYVDISYNELCWIWFEYIVGLDDAETLRLERNSISLDRPEFADTNKTLEEFNTTLASLITLSLKENPLNVIPEMFFASLRKSPVAYVSLEGCELYYIHPEAFKTLKDLIILDLSENPKLMPNLTIAFNGLRDSKLQKLGMRSNLLQEVPKDIITLIQNTVVELDFKGNSFFSTITRTSFPEQMPKLRSLNLEDCKINVIGLGTFDGMPLLSDLILKGNRLNVFPPAITTLTKLSVLDVQNQTPATKNFQIIPDTFKDLKNLRLLYLSSVPLKFLEKSALNGLIGLNILMLDNTQLSTIEDFTFDGLRTLRTLSLSGNQLSTLNSNIFYGLGYLQNLYLESCGLTIPTERARIDSKTSDENFDNVYGGYSSEFDFDSEERLVVQKPVIDFATVGRTFNEIIKSVSGEVDEPEGSTFEPFQYLYRLQYLMVSNNKLRDLSPKLFGNMPYLKTLDLSHNSIDVWSNRILVNNTVIENLYLQHNNLITITDAMMEDFEPFRPNRTNPTPTNLDMSGNPFLCDKGTCKLKAQVMTNEIQLQHWEFADKYLCRFPDSPTERIPLITLEDSFCNPEEVSTTPSTPLPTREPVSTPTTYEYPDGKGNSNEPSSSNSFVTVAIIASCSVILVCGGIVVYKKRGNFRYYWFAAKFNIKRANSWKSQTSDLVSESGNHEYDVFISYSHHDSEFIQDALVPELEGRGKLMDGSRNEETQVQMDKDLSEPDAFRVCLHERDFEVGTPITENIIECVDNSRKVIVLVSRNYLESQWCLFEMNLAYHRLIESRRKSFLVIVLEQVPTELRTKILNYLMRSRTYLQWPGNDAPAAEKKLFWARLRSSLASDD